MRFNLSYSLSARANFDEAVRIYAEDCVECMSVNYLKFTPTGEIVFDHLEAAHQYDVDDKEEALLRFKSVFREVVVEAKQNCVI